MATTDAGPMPGRLRSVDAYRGFVMLAMASGGLGLAGVAHNLSKNSGEEIALDLLARQVEHVSWRGCVFWDLIQPSFMFLVGVAMPFSFAARTARGEPWARQFAHALWRSVVLVALGVFLASAWSPATNWTFVNVLAQIGLGYWFVFLMLGRKPWAQVAVVATILVGYWALFALYPVPTEEVSPIYYGLGPGWDWQAGFARHWEKNLNVAADFDRWFLNLFPREQPFVFNEGGYQTLNFVPSIATMLIGVLAGQWLRSDHQGPTKVLGLLLAGAVCLIVGSFLDPYGLGPTPYSHNLEARVFCPIVKRIWTPAWVISSTAWTCWFLACFYALIDVWQWRKWSFPLVVVGMNSIAIYLMAQLMKPWARKQIAIHSKTFGLEPFAGTYGPMIESLSVLLVLWLICFWMYRRKIFLRI